MSVAILLAHGFEEVEAFTPIDFLRRAGIAVTTASITNSKEVISASKVIVQADALLKDLSAQDFDAVVLPGGAVGSQTLGASDETAVFVSAIAAKGGWVAAICAVQAYVFPKIDLLKNKRYTCHPTAPRENIVGGTYLEDAVVVDGKIITGRGPGAAAAFTATIIDSVLGTVGRGRSLLEAALYVL